MPKIIKNLQIDILNESMKIIDAEGIDALSIRLISKKLGIAPSTIYNYYKSKEAIIGALMITRWNEILKKIDDECGKDNQTSIESLSKIVNVLRSSLKALLLFHASPNSCMIDTTSHIHEHKKMIFEQLQIRVKLILKNQNDSYNNIDNMSSVITKILIICLHDENLDFEDLANAIKKL